MVDRIPPTARRPALEPNELREEAGVVEKLDAPRIEKRQELAVEVALHLVRYAICNADYAERMGAHTARIFAYCTLGFANILNRAWHEALEALGQALAIGRERRLLVWEGGVTGLMAAAHLGLGDSARALALAEEAIAVSQRRGTRLWEFPALLTRIRALRAIRGIEAAQDIEAALAEADAWLEMSGAKSYEPFLHVERAELARLKGDEASRDRELREAHRLFLEIGAPIRAEQVAKELR
jgi:tetratricopeptide (TPR) repeat protein